MMGASVSCITHLHTDTDLLKTNLFKEAHAVSHEQMSTRLILYDRDGERKGEEGGTERVQVYDREIEQHGQIRALKNKWKLTF